MHLITSLKGLYFNILWSIKEILHFTNKTDLKALKSPILTVVFVFLLMTLATKK